MDIGDSCGHGVVELVDILMKLLASIDVRQGASTSMWTATSCRKHPRLTVDDALFSVDSTLCSVEIGQYRVRCGPHRAYCGQYRV